MKENLALIPTFRISFGRARILKFQLFASQILPRPPEEVFPFFRDPRNLCRITPEWLDFRLLDREKAEVFEGAEYDYTIRWLGLKIPWRSRIINLRPPETFTDIQMTGPYRSWRHIHTFYRIREGTHMTDQVIYILPLIALPLHRFVIQRQLQSIFTYRALRIDEWAAGSGLNI